MFNDDGNAAENVKWNKDKGTWDDLLIVFKLLNVSKVRYNWTAMWAADINSDN